MRDDVSATSIALPSTDLSARSTAYRLSQQNLIVDGVPFDLTKYPFWIDLYNLYDGDPASRPKDVCIKKCSQIGVTTWAILSTIEHAKWLYPRGILYLFPGKDEVTDFSKARFDRLVQANPCIAAIMGDIKNATLKQVGDCWLYFRGARSASPLESIPIDAIRFDERDKMDDAMINIALHRLDAADSDLGHTASISTPEYPEEGIELQYELSTQDIWIIKCHACQTWTCLELEWPQCLQRHGRDTVLRVCKKCEREIFVRDGQWLRRHPDRALVGFWISQLCSPTVDPATILNEHETGITSQGIRVDIGDFHRRRLGLGYAEENARLQEGQILACCGQQPPAGTFDGPTGMGVDVNKGAYHWHVGINESATHVRVLAYGVAKTTNEILEIADRYTVRCGVIDAYPELNTVAAFCKKHPRWWRCQYDEARTAPLWNPADRLLKVNRTDIHDQIHARFLERTIVYPRQNEATREIVAHVKAMYRVLYKDKRINELRAKWNTGGSKPDHYRHTLGYLLLALTKTPILPRTGRFHDRFQRVVRSAGLRRKTGSI